MSGCSGVGVGISVDRPASPSPEHPASAAAPMAAVPASSFRLVASDWYIC
jgi:hypothetical protein